MAEVSLAERFGNAAQGSRGVNAGTSAVDGRLADIGSVDLEPICGHPGFQKSEGDRIRFLAAGAGDAQDPERSRASRRELSACRRLEHGERLGMAEEPAFVNDQFLDQGLKFSRSVLELVEVGFEAELAQGGAAAIDRAAKDGSAEGRRIEADGRL
ncbi:MAG: hypothetical protein K6T85_14045 [Gorillibacterium sp.]|nr:hypothetical protein [Gorillibacterium sp.]